MKKMNAPCFLLAGLCLISCAGEQEIPGPDRGAPPPTSAEVSPHLAALLPARGEAPGWAISQQARAFRPENLWQFIDGAADRYLAYGFEEVITSEYVQEATGCKMLIDIYRMKNPLSSYGIYTQERSPDYQFLKVGNEGYSAGGALNFWAGAYYVKITAFEQKDAVLREMMRLASAVASKVKTPGAEPVEAGYFPKRNQLPHTTVYVPRDVLGQSYLVNGLETKYRADGKEYRMILVMLETSEAARSAMARHREFLSGGGAPVNDLTAPGEGGFSGKDSFYGNVVAVRSGRSIAMILGAFSENEGKTLLAELLANIR